MTKYPQPVVEGVAGTVPLGRLGTEEEFAWLVAYLASPAGDYFSGAVLTIDGARDNWFGAWPPAAWPTRGGKPLARRSASRGSAMRGRRRGTGARARMPGRRPSTTPHLDALASRGRGPTRRG